jgi:tetratricopeptide (TPR) repeat protein
MKQKIEWYREVLDLEPGSKVFFPLAKLLVADDQIDAALAVLHQGIERHPEFIEARLFLVELLHQNGQDGARNAEAIRLSELFSAYPAFWTAWGMVAGAGASSPQGSALLFLAAAMRDQNISWNEIIDSGVRALIGSLGVAPQASSPATKKDDAPPAVTVFAHNDSSLNKTIVNEVPAAVVSDLIEPSANEEPEAIVVSDFLEPSALVPDFDNDDSIQNAFDVEEPAHDEQPSVRTRSMAEVLIEQGDLRGAKEIYDELLQAASEKVVTAELQRRIAELDERILRAGSSNFSPAKLEEPVSAVSGKDKVVNMLKLLANRLENRAG